MRRKIDWYIKNISTEIVNRQKIIKYIVIALSLLLAFMIINYGLNVDKKYLVGNVLLIPMIAIYIKANKRYIVLKNILYLKEQWGKEVTRSKKTKIGSILFKYLYKYDKEKYLDDQTWSDLNMDKMYEKLNRTLTTPGKETLYNMLRRPLFDVEKLSKRAETIEAFKQDKVLRTKIQLALLNLGMDPNKNITEFLWDDIPKPSKLRYLFLFMSIVSIASIVQLFFTGLKGIFPVILVYMANLMIHGYMSKRYSHKIPTITYLNSLIKTALVIQNEDVEGIERYQDNLKQSTKDAKKILRKAVFLKTQLYTDTTDVIYEYFKVIFLLEVNSFNGALDLINKNIDELKEIYQTVGEIDALQSVASYREDIGEFTEPEFNNSGYLLLKDVRHPLLENPVSNSIDINHKGILITGSNMAGKSTFLRTIGTNMVLAQTIYTCSASSYKGQLFNIVTSISQTDDLSEGKSFYFTESERLLKMIQLSEREYPTLCIIDELLAGTNSLERLSASEEILKYMIRNNALIAIATHDLELAKRLHHEYKCYYFNDNVSEKGLDFDYKIKEGIAVTSNAIKLLDYLGYPKEIVNKAKEKVTESIDRFDN